MSLWFNRFRCLAKRCFLCFHRSALQYGLRVGSPTNKLKMKIYTDNVDSSQSLDLSHVDHRWRLDLTRVTFFTKWLDSNHYQWLETRFRVNFTKISKHLADKSISFVSKQMSFFLQWLYQYCSKLFWPVLNGSDIFVVLIQTNVVIVSSSPTPIR